MVGRANCGRYCGAGSLAGEWGGGLPGLPLPARSPPSPSQPPLPHSQMTSPCKPPVCFTLTCPAPTPYLPGGRGEATPSSQWERDPAQGGGKSRWEGGRGLPPGLGAADNRGSRRGVPGEAGPGLGGSRAAPRRGACEAGQKEGERTPLPGERQGAALPPRGASR
ncbi:unnamed protein product [Caretta caretta]